jgi:hypothetical protein
LNTKLKMNSDNNKSSASGSELRLALFRLALLVGPEIVAIKMFSHSPVVCVGACVGILAMWLSVDVGPFRATPTVVEAKAPAVKTPLLAKIQGAGYLICKTILFAALLQSRVSNL